MKASILPHFDFQHMARIAMARNWHLASPEQRTALIAEFRTLLVRTYSKALTEWKASVTACRKGVFFPPVMSGAPTLSYKTETNSTISSLPAPANVVTQIQARMKSPAADFFGVLIIQQRGPVLDIVSLSSPAKPTAEQVGTMTGFAGVTGQRLAGASL